MKTYIQPQTECLKITTDRFLIDFSTDIEGLGGFLPGEDGGDPD